VVKKRTARDVMKAPVITAKEDMLITDAMKLMSRWRISGLPVVDDDGKLIGMITGRLIMNDAVSGNAARTRVSEVMSRQLEIYGPTYAPDTAVDELVNHFAASRINRVLIIEDGKVIGIISRIDIISELNRIYSRFVK
jgi:CBS domain-containing protein